MGGVFGVFGHKEAAVLTYLGLYGLQHRGLRRAGIVSSGIFDDEEVNEKERKGADKFFNIESGEGKVTEVFTKEKIEQFVGMATIGYIGTKENEIQPIKVERLNEAFTFCYDGKIANSTAFRAKLERLGAVFCTQSEAEIVAHLICRASKNSFLEKLFNSLRELKGAFSLLVLSKNGFIAVRDPYGFKPLCLGELDGAYVFASESCAFDVISAKYLREVKPGEAIVITSEEMKSYFPFESQSPRFCVYEWVYLSRPDSRVFEDKVAAKIRTKLGKELAKGEKVQADVVIPLPDTSNNAALGFSWELEMRCHFDIIRSHYIEHSPEEPEEKIKDFGTKIKFNLVPELLDGKKVILVVHSLIRGKQISEIVQMIKSQAKEVHLRVSSPPIVVSCRYGMDFPGEDFIAKNLKSEETIAKAIGADSVRYLTIEGLHQALGDPFFKSHCYACLSGDYPF